MACNSMFWLIFFICWSLSFIKLLSNFIAHFRWHGSHYFYDFLYSLLSILSVLLFSILAWNVFWLENFALTSCSILPPFQQHKASVVVGIVCAFFMELFFNFTLQTSPLEEIMSSLTNGRLPLSPPAIIYAYTYNEKREHSARVHALTHSFRSVNVSSSRN